MNKTMEELQAYYNRKKDRRDDAASNMELYLTVDNYDMAEVYRKKSDELTAELHVIKHCMHIIRTTLGGE